MMKHIPVLADKLVQIVPLEKKGIYVDGTYGLGGHSKTLLKKKKDIKIIGIEIDKYIYEEALKEKPSQVVLFNDSFINFDFILASLSITGINGILIDLGLSSLHCEKPEYGFSYSKDSPLDFRFDRNSSLTAEEIINSYSEEELNRIFKEFGEEKFYKKISKEIVRKRKKERIKTSKQLVEILKKILPKKYGYPLKGITRVFQALRIEVNKELENLTIFLEKIKKWILPEGWIAIISYHSLEDKIVKNYFSKYTKKCICPPDSPICTCGIKQKFEWVGKKKYKPSKEEVENNPRSRSAILRVIKKIGR